MMGQKRPFCLGGGACCPRVFSTSRGEFEFGDLVRCCDLAGNEFARGLVNYPGRDVRLIKGLHSSKIESTLGHKLLRRGHSSRQFGDLAGAWLDSCVPPAPCQPLRSVGDIACMYRLRRWGDASSWGLGRLMKITELVQDIVERAQSATRQLAKTA